MAVLGAVRWGHSVGLDSPVLPAGFAVAFIASAVRGHISSELDGVAAKVESRRTISAIPATP